MSNTIGDINLQLLLDTTAFGEGIKNALNILANFHSQTKNLLNMSAMKFDTSGIDKLISENEKLQTGLRKTASEEQVVAATSVKVNATLSESGKRTFEFSNSLQNLGLKFEGLKALYTVLLTPIKEYIAEANAAEIANAKLSNGLKNVGEGTKSFESLSAQAEQLKSLTPFDDEEIKNAQAMLTTFMKSSEEISILTPRILDLAAAYMKAGDSSMDLQQIAVMVGKVNEETIGQLRRVGVAFTKEQEEKLKSLKGTEQAIYLSGILDQNFKGMAETIGQTSAGQMKIFNNELGELKKSLGFIAKDVISYMLPTLRSIVDFFKTAPPYVQTSAIMVTLLGTAFYFLNGAISPTVKTFAILSALMFALPPTFRALTSGVMILVGAIWAYNVAMTASATATTIASGGLNIAIGLIAAGVAGIASFMFDLGESSTQLETKLNASATSVSSYASKLNNLNLVKTLSASSTKLTAEQEENYKTALSSLSQEFPQLISGIDGKTNSLNVNAQALDLVIAKQRELASIELFKKLGEDADEIKKSSDSLNKLEGDLLKATRQRDYFQKQSDDYAIGLAKATSATDKNAELIAHLGEKYAEAETELNKWSAEVKVAESNNMGLLNSVTGVIGKYMQFGEIDTLLSKLISTTGSNSAAVVLLGRSLGNMGADGFAAIFGINSGLLKHTDVFKAFAAAWQVFTQAVQSGDMAAVKSAYDKMIETLNAVKVENAKLNDKQKAPTAPKNMGSYKSKDTTPDIAKEESEVDKLIKSWERLIEIYYMADNVKKSLDEKGKNEVDILEEVNKEIDTRGKYEKSDIEKFGKFKEKIEVDVEIQMNFTPPKNRDKFIEKYIKALKDKKDEQLERRGSKSVTPWSEAEAYDKALEAYEKMYGRDLKIPDYEFLITKTKEELDALQKTGKEYDRQATFQEKIYNYQQKINDLKQQSADFDRETHKMEIEQIINTWQKKQQLINFDYSSKKNPLGKDLEEGKITERQHKKRVDALDKEKSLALTNLQKEAAKEVFNSFQSSVSAVQSIANTLGLGADSFVSKFLGGLQSGISLVSSIISLISSIGSMASGIPFMGGGGGLLSLLGFASGGEVPGSGNSDSVPAMLTPGEFVINKLRASQLGSNFLGWLNGGNVSPALAGAYASGGYVSPAAAQATQVIITPRVLGVEGETLKIAYDKTTKRINRWKV